MYHVTVIRPVHLTTRVIREWDSVYVWKESQAGRATNVSRDMHLIRENVFVSQNEITCCSSIANYDMTFVSKTSHLSSPRILPFWGIILQFQSLILF